MELYAAIITGIFGLITGIFVGYREDIIEFFSKKHRRIEGTWSGLGSDIQVPIQLEYINPQSYKFICQIKQNGKKIKGEFSSESDKVYSLKLKGEIKEDLLLTTYENSDKNTTDYGVCILQLNGTGKNLDGYFLGKRTREYGIVLGNVNLKRE